MPTLEERVTDLENNFHDYTTWVVFWDGNKYDYRTIRYCKRFGIDYLPTEYFNAGEARAAARSMNH